LAGIANTVYSIARVLQYFLKIIIGIGTVSQKRGPTLKRYSSKL